MEGEIANSANIDLIGIAAGASDIHTGKLKLFASGCIYDSSLLDYIFSQSFFCPRVVKLIEILASAPSYDNGKSQYVTLIDMPENFSVRL